MNRTVMKPLSTPSVRPEWQNVTNKIKEENCEKRNEDDNPTFLLTRVGRIGCKFCWATRGFAEANAGRMHGVL